MPLNTGINYKYNMNFIYLQMKKCPASKKLQYGQSMLNST